MANLRRLHTRDDSDGDEVSHVELFFDLIFVFSLTQVTAMMAADPSTGVIRGILVLGILWWSWTGYAWLGNVIRANEVAGRLALIGAMAAMFVLALAIPEAFEDGAGGVDGPVVLAVCYFVVRALHLCLFWIISTGDMGLRNQLVRFGASMLGAAATLLIASQTHGWTQIALWALVLIIDYVGTYLGGASGWRLRSAHHFAERHSLILIVALGESIIAIGVGVAQLPISWPIIVASILGLGLSTALWWAYFDTAEHAGRTALESTPSGDVARLARDAYSFIHLPIIVSVVMAALGLKKALEYVGDATHHDLSDPLKGVGLYAFCGGVALFLLAVVGFNRRIGESVNVSRLIVAALILAFIPLGQQSPAIATLAVVTALVGTMLVVEASRSASATPSEMSSAVVEWVMHTTQLG